MSTDDVHGSCPMRFCSGWMALWVASCAGCVEPPAPVDNETAPVAATGSLLPSPRREQADLARRLARELEKTLVRLPDVHGARVHITPEDPSWLGRDAGPRSAVVLLVASKPTPETTDHVQRIVAKAAGIAQPQNVAVVPVSPSEAEPAPKASEPPKAPLALRAPLVGSLLLNAVLAILLMVLNRRRRA